MSPRIWHAMQHPLAIPLALIGAAAGVDIAGDVRAGRNWMDVHFPIFMVGVAVVLAVYLISRRDRVWTRAVSDSFDHVRVKHDLRIEELLHSRDAQIEHNKAIRDRVEVVESRIDTLEQLPILHAARQRTT